MHEANRPVSNTAKLRERFEFRKAVQFTMEWSTLESLMEQLQVRNEDLWRLIKKTNMLQQLEEDLRDARKELDFAPSLSWIQSSATRVHQALSRSWCTSTCTHSAGLLLEPRLSRDYIADCFEMCILQVHSQRKWLDAEFKLVKDTSR